MEKKPHTIFSCMVAIVMYYFLLIQLQRYKHKQLTIAIAIAIVSMVTHSICCHLVMDIILHYISTSTCFNHTCTFVLIRWFGCKQLIHKNTEPNVMKQLISCIDKLSLSNHFIVLVSQLATRLHYIMLKRTICR